MKHSVRVADENAQIKYNDRTKLKVKLHSQGTVAGMGLCMT